jgi:DNA-3-methyladenine glycosylase
MFGPPGYAYVYFTYGMHWMLNVAAQDHGIGAAVLIRAAEPITGIPKMWSNRPKAAKNEDLLSGPAKICAAFEIGPEEYGMNLFDPSSGLRIEPGESPVRVLHGPRIGLAEGKGERHLWRFADGGALRWVSSPKSDLQPLLFQPDHIAPAT